MPIYLYQVVRADGSEGEVFEVEQGMNEPHLVKHPQTGEPVKRVYVAPNIASKYTPGHTKKLLDTKNVERAGFTKYERDKATGTYHRTAGKDGPATLRPNG